jgi:CubicO group peptidase (beta-lactamase class C family)
LVSCASDLLRYLQAQMDPDSTLLGEAIRLTQTEHAHQIGLGWMRNPKPHLLLWHNGGTGGFRSFAGFVPQERTAVVVLSNHARFVDLTALRLLRTLTEDSA